MVAENSENSKENETTAELEDRVVCIRRCSKVVKGGRNFSFSALVVVGNKNGKVVSELRQDNEGTEADSLLR